MRDPPRNGLGNFFKEVCLKFLFFVDWALRKGTSGYVGTPKIFKRISTNDSPDSGEYVAYQMMLKPLQCLI